MDHDHEDSAETTSPQRRSDTPRDVMISLLEKWTGAAKDRLETMDDLQLDGYFNRAADPRACMMTFGAAAAFAGGAVASFLTRNYYAAVCLAGAAILDGASSVYCYRQNREVAAELKRTQPGL